jgi:hypothetical protein
MLRPKIDVKGIAGVASSPGFAGKASRPSSGFKVSNPDPVTTMERNVANKMMGKKAGRQPKPGRRVGQTGIMPPKAKRQTFPGKSTMR